MGNKPKKQAKEPIEKGFGNDKLGTIVRKERHKIGVYKIFSRFDACKEAATEWDELEVVRKSITNHDYTTASTPENVAHNRYPNVMALEATRVKFTNRYINANWIDGLYLTALLSFHRIS
jgi:protein tyrosine phosphatase